MKTIKEIDDRIEELKNKYFKDESKELINLLKRALEITDVKDYKVFVSKNNDDILVEATDILMKLTKYKTLAEARSDFAEGNRRLCHSTDFLRLITEGLKQGVSEQQAIKNVWEEKELEMITRYIANSMVSIYKALDKFISVNQTLRKGFGKEFNQQNI